jgi:hypothetical protein
VDYEELMASLLKRALSAVRDFFGWQATPSLLLPRRSPHQLFAVLAPVAARRRERSQKRGR